MQIIIGLLFITSVYSASELFQTELSLVSVEPLSRTNYRPSTSDLPNFEAEALRQQDLIDSFPPVNSSYFTPYGDRTIISFRFPPIIKQHVKVKLHKKRNSQKRDVVSELPQQPLRDSYEKQPDVGTSGIPLRYEIPPESVYALPNQDKVQSKGHPGPDTASDPTHGPPQLEYGPPQIAYGPPHVAYGPPQVAYGPPQPAYGPPVYGHEKPVYGPLPLAYGPPLLYGPPRTLEKGDLATIISQNYVYQQNIRDYSSMFKANRTTPSNELVLSLAQSMVSEFIQRNRKMKPSKSFPPKTLSFVVVALESRMRSRKDTAKFGFTQGNSYTNGSLIFQTPSDETLLTVIPFRLQSPSDIEDIFNSQPEDSQKLLPKDKTDIQNFLRIMSDIHEDVHEDGRETLKRYIKRSDALGRPRLPRPEKLFQDGLADMDVEARKTKWLYTSTVGIRVLSIEQPLQLVKLLKTFVYPVPVVRQPAKFWVHT